MLVAFDGVFDARYQFRYRLAFWFGKSDRRLVTMTTIRVVFARFDFIRVLVVDRPFVVLGWCLAYTCDDSRVRRAFVDISIRDNLDVMSQFVSEIEEVEESLVLEQTELAESRVPGRWTRIAWGTLVSILPVESVPIHVERVEVLVIELERFLNGQV